MSDERHMGLGWMIGYLRGNADSVEAFTQAVGKTIASLEIKDENDGELHMRFTDDTGIVFYDDARSCCESRYMRTDDDLSYHVGAKLLDAELSEAPDEDHEYGTHEIMFLVITTDKGKFTLASHNEHNGYYAGISILVRDINKKWGRWGAEA